ncbi:rhodanese-like domain-containing protein [Luteipulveratus halotolerans]|nr:rhodanese-like domain-containing protein [Luteipulveratus halotolerans]
MDITRAYTFNNGMPGAPTSYVRWETSLFSGGVQPCPEVDEPGRVSPRAAYQDALWGRATLVDVRPRHRRAVVVHPDLEPRDAVDVSSWNAPVILCGDHEAEVAPVAAALRRHGLREVWVLAGGITQWRAEGFPTATV